MSGNLCLHLSTAVTVSTGDPKGTRGRGRRLLSVGRVPHGSRVEELTTYDRILFREMFDVSGPGLRSPVTGSTPLCPDEDLSIPSPECGPRRGSRSTRTRPWFGTTRSRRTPQFAPDIEEADSDDSPNLDPPPPNVFTLKEP